VLRWDGFSGVVDYADNRQPLSTTFAARYINIPKGPNARQQLLALAQIVLERIK